MRLYRCIDLWSPCHPVNLVDQIFTSLKGKVNRQLVTNEMTPSKLFVIFCCVDRESLCTNICHYDIDIL